MARHEDGSPAEPQAGRLSFARAQQIVRENASALPSVSQPPGESLGRILASDVLAESDHPPFDTAAMDGFAFAAAATKGAGVSTPLELAVTAVAAAGAPAEAGEGGAVEIMTGAPMPSHCDTIVMVEKCEVADDGATRWLIVLEPVGPGRNVRRQGEDARRGELVMRAGSRLTAAAIGALTTYGVRSVQIGTRPLVAVMPTGDELTPRHEALGSASIYDSNGPMISALAVEAGARSLAVPAVRDDVTSTAEAIDRLARDSGADIIVSTGGVSVGARDCIPAALHALGAQIRFHGVGMRPGKPVLFAILPGGTLFFGLPGNPFAAYVGFRFFVNAALRAMLGLGEERGVLLSADLPGRPGTTLIQKARVDVDRAGRLVAVILAGQQSHMLRPLLEANALVAIDGTGSEDSVRAFPISPSRGSDL